MVEMIMLINRSKFSTLERKEGYKVRNKPKGKCISIRFWFFGQSAIEYKVGFRIDSHTIKRGTLKRL
jgi:hypothetical protein